MSASPKENDESPIPVYAPGGLSMNPFSGISGIFFSGVVETNDVYSSNSVSNNIGPTTDTVETESVDSLQKDDDESQSATESDFSKITENSQSEDVYSCVVKVTEDVNTPVYQPVEIKKELPFDFENVNIPVYQPVEIKKESPFSIVSYEINSDDSDYEDGKVNDSSSEIGKQTKGKVLHTEGSISMATMKQLQKISEVVQGDSKNCDALKSTTKQDKSCDIRIDVSQAAKISDVSVLDKRNVVKGGNKVNATPNSKHYRSKSSSSDSESEEESSKESGEVCSDDGIYDEDTYGYSNKRGKKNLGLVTKGELLLEDLPTIQDLQISVDCRVNLVRIGEVSGIINELVIVKGDPGTPALDIDTVFFNSNRLSMGLVFEVLGPVTSPFYSLRFNSNEHIEMKRITIGDEVFCAPSKSEYTQFVFLEQLKRIRGSDASWENNNEVPARYRDFSDDEDEKREKARLKAEKRESGPQQPKNLPHGNDDNFKKRRKFNANDELSEPASGMSSQNQKYPERKKPDHTHRPRGNRNPQPNSGNRPRPGNPWGRTSVATPSPPPPSGTSPLTVQVPGMATYGCTSPPSTSGHFVIQQHALSHQPPIPSPALMSPPVLIPGRAFPALRPNATSPAPFAFGRQSDVTTWPPR